MKQPSQSRKAIFPSFEVLIIALRISALLGIHLIIWPATLWLEICDRLCPENLLLDLDIDSGIRVWVPLFHLTVLLVGIVLNAAYFVALYQFAIYLS